MKDCEKILTEMNWRMTVMAEEKKGSDEVWALYGYGVFKELMGEWYYENYLGVGHGDSWGIDYRDVLLDFIEFIGMSVLWNREIEIVLVGKWWMGFLMDMDRESGLRLDSMIFELINVYKGSEEV